MLCLRQKLSEYVVCRGGHHSKKVILVGLGYLRPINQKIKFNVWKSMRTTPHFLEQPRDAAPFSNNALSFHKLWGLRWYNKVSVI